MISLKVGVLMKIAFLDRDGTIINDYPDEEWHYIKEPVFIEDSIATLKKLTDLKYHIIIITNQYIINSGIITISQYNAFTDLFKSILQKNGINILDIFYCPHTLDENCNCFKPKPGLIEQAISKYPNIDMKNSFLVGDSLCDIELGNKVGIRTFGIKVRTNKFIYTEINSLSDIIGLL
jgi:D-glycero-D-manno-heptose 1,7-bisphosphate phosphatase